MSPADNKAQARPLLAELPEIPRKRYFAIGEVSDLCDVKPHVLRYWEQEFPQLRPVKRRGNRRYYQQEDVLMVRRIRSLLYEQGFTIGGARQRLKDLAKHGGPANELPKPSAPASPRHRAEEIRELRGELESLLRLFPE
ncbi:MerR family transcriptional regulator [Fontimonas sp. SYSU GA230001]|uniref:MerR family transcriptional regulator n=1 Tax=Fontimonas sp. SYSU GA230001 TaxID=3142450 RepID=UPI0032B36527